MKPHLASWIFRWLPTDADAITFGRHVFFRETYPSERLVRHEAEHVKQYKEHGVVRFLFIYLRDYVSGRLIGLSHRDAYRNIRFEVLAREAEARDN